MIKCRPFSLVPVTAPEPRTAHAEGRADRGAVRSLLCDTLWVVYYNLRLRTQIVDSISLCFSSAGPPILLLELAD
jgi:hypothetical protein